MIDVVDDLPVVRSFSTYRTVITAEILLYPLPGLPWGVFLSGQGDGAVDVTPSAVVGGEGEFKPLLLFGDLRKTVVLLPQVGDPGLEVCFRIEELLPGDADTDPLPA